VGRAETSVDPAPVNMSETTITFKPKDQWPKGLTKDAILGRLDDKLQIPGVRLSSSPPSSRPSSASLSPLQGQPADFAGFA
jgi:Cu(I)/Ag(I) efflux system membrane protein CusA/SilA